MGVQCQKRESKEKGGEKRGDHARKDERWTQSPTARINSRKKDISFFD